VMLIVGFPLDDPTSANCIRCELATVCERAVPMERKLRRSRAYGSRWSPVTHPRDAGQRHTDYLKLTIVVWSYGLGPHRMRESRIRCDCFPGGIVVVSRGLACPLQTVIGYQASPGWDPATGWGSPNAQALIPLLARYTSS
jgi:hypothetical protein